LIKPILTMIIWTALCAALAGCQSDGKLSQHLAKGCRLFESEAGCATRIAREEAADDTKCRGYGAQPGTDVYVQCRVGLDQIKATESAARASRASTRELERGSGFDEQGRACLGQFVPNPYGPPKLVCD
jgi:hypothetical protein